MTFGAAIRTCLARYLAFPGSSGRAEYRPGNHAIATITSLALCFPILAATMPVPGWLNCPAVPTRSAMIRFRMPVIRYPNSRSRL